VTLPNDAALVGALVRFQGLYNTGAPVPFMSNHDCIKVFN
jgi:hypothetical protein